MFKGFLPHKSNALFQQFLSCRFLIGNVLSLFVCLFVLLHLVLIGVVFLKKTDKISSFLFADQIRILESQNRFVEGTLKIM